MQFLFKAVVIYFLANNLLTKEDEPSIQETEAVNRLYSWALAVMSIVLIVLLVGFAAFGRQWL